MPSKRAKLGAVDDDVPKTGGKRVEGATIKEEEEEGPGSGVHRAVGILRPEDGSFRCMINGASPSSLQPSTGRVDHEPFRKTIDNMFVDKGYGSFPVPGSDNDNGDGDDRVLENKDKLMKRINDSLGLASPFVQKRKDKVQKKPVT